VEVKASGEGGLVGFLKWAALNHTAAYMSQLGRVMPIQLNTRTETKQVVRYETYEEKRASLIERGWSPRVIALIEQASEPQFLKKLRDDRRPGDGGGDEETSH
jgi:hypothetical protein